MSNSVIATVFSNCATYVSAWLRRPDHYCVCCDAKVLAFLPYKGGSAHAPAIVAEAKMVGSDLDNFSCTRCGSTDRERHLFLYLRELEFTEKIRGARILHFAPEKKLSELIAGLDPARHIRADLFPSEPGMEKVDMQDIQYESDSFDLVIANHVLEHVSDDAVALGELYRVLCPGGFAILQTPYAAGRDATESEPDGAFTDRQRLEHFGQEDHVRLFGLDIFQRIEAAGFRSHVGDHAGALKDYDAAIHGVNPLEPFMCFSKPAAD